jgi:hypothetical protein
MTPTCERWEPKLRWSPRSSYAFCEPRGDVHCVAGREALLRPGHDLPRVDADASGDAELGEGVAHLDGRAAGAECVVLVRRRHPEDGHHRVADELLHRTAVGLHDSLHPLEVAREQCPQRLRIRRLAERGRSGHVAEDDRDRLALHRHAPRLEHRTELEKRGYAAL